MSEIPPSERPRPGRRARLALPALLLALLPVPVACQLTGPGFEQVPPIVREKEARSEARGGPYADPPLQRYPEAFVDPQRFSERFDERLDGIEERLAAAEAGGREALGAAATEGELSRDRDADLAESVRVEAEVARAGRERLAEEVGELETELEVRTDAAASEVEQLGAEFASSLEHETEQNARLTDLEATFEAFDADLARRVIALEDSADERVDGRAGDDDRTSERLDAVELALAERPAPLPPPASDELDALRAELERLGNELAASTNEPRSGSMPSTATSSFLAFGLGDAGLLIVVIAVIVLLALHFVRMRSDRERDRHSARVFDRIEDAVRALDEHVARQVARDEERAREAERAAAAAHALAEEEAETVIVVEDDEAEVEERVAAHAGEPQVEDAGAEETGGRWGRFVERVEGQREEPERVVIERREPSVGTPRRRVLDRGFLERYRGRS